MSVERFWFPVGWDHPRRLQLPTGHHLRPISAADVDIDHPAVMGSQARLWSILGSVWGWPPETMTRDEDGADLARHEAEMARRQSFNYALLDRDETELLGCVYLDPPAKLGADADVSWWVVDQQLGSIAEAALDAAVPRWVTGDWPFERPRFIGPGAGRQLGWDNWLGLPDNHSANPQFWTDRLYLRDAGPGDLDLLTGLDADPGVKRYIDNEAPIDRDELASMLEWWLGYHQRSPGYGFWMAFNRRSPGPDAAPAAADPVGFEPAGLGPRGAGTDGPSNDFVGWFHLRPGEGRPSDEPELGYRLHRSWWGTGLATEASAALIDHGFERLGARLVYAETMVVNLASRRVMEKSGMTQVRTFHADWPVTIPGDEHGDVEYAITRPEWKRSRAAGSSLR